MKCIFRSGMLALLLSGGIEHAYCQLDLSASTIRLEDDTYTSMMQYLRAGNREAAMNLINRDPLVARFALIRLLRDFGGTERARTFAEMFQESSRSEIEIPFIQLYESLSSGERRSFLDWMETASRAEFVIARETQEKAWSDASAQAITNLESARQFFRTAAFPAGEAFCLRIMASRYFWALDIPSFNRVQQLYEQANSLYAAAQNTRGEALALAGLGRLRRRTNELPRSRQYVNEGLTKLRDAGDRIAEIYLSFEYPDMLSIDDRNAAWTTLELLPALTSLKYFVLFQLVQSEKRYLDTIQAMLAREPDPITAAYYTWQLFNLELDPVMKAQYADRAIEMTRHLPYDRNGETPEAAVAMMLERRGWLESNQLQYSRAEATFLAALEETRKSDDRSELGSYLRNQAWLLYCLAYLYETTGDYPRAMQKAQEALTIATQINYRNYMVQDMGIIARVHSELGELHLSEEVLSKATQIYAPIMSEAHTDLAEIHLNLGFYAKALKDLDELDALLKQRIAGGSGSVFLTQRLRLMTLIWLRIGDLPKAMDFAKAVESRPGGHEIDEGVVGMVWIEMKRYAEAEKYFNDRLTHKEWGKGAEADSHKNLGRLYRLQNRRPEAIEHLTKALEIYRAMFRRRDELELSIELGQVALGGGKPNEARLYFQQALQLAEEGQWPQGIWSVRAGLADLANAENNTSAAVEHLKLAVNAVETVSARMKSELTRSTFVEDKVALYDELIRLTGSSRPEQAFEYAERRRAQSFIESARSQGIPLTSDSGNELVRKKKVVEARLIGKQKVLWEQYSKPPASRSLELINAINRDLNVIRSEHTEVLRRIQEADPVEASRQGIIHAVTAGEVQRDILKPGDALIEYLVTGRGIYAFVITSAQSRFVRLPATQDVTAQHIQRLMAPFAQLRAGQVDLLHMNYDVPLANQLYKDLIAPLEPYIGRSRRLIIIPDDVLNYLPFESLARSPAVGVAKANVRYAQYQSVDWLVNHYSIVYAVSATSLHPRFYQSKPKPDSLLAFGNPKLNIDQFDKATTTLRGGGMDAYIPTLGALPQSAREATTVARLLGPKVRSTVFTGEKARKDEFIRQGTSAGYIHFAVHSVVNEQQPYYSALVLSPDGTSDGLLQTYEILSMRLNARLVTLSSCETGLGKLYKGEGLLGLRRAFLMAGAESVVVSFWSIDDSTADFMEIFYDNISRGPSIADALRAAKLRYLKKTMSVGTQQISLSHPFFWAPFALTSTFLQ